MLNHLLIEQCFPTPIGIVACGLSSTCNEVNIVDHINYNNGNAIVYKTLAHIVEVVEFKQRLPLYNGEVVIDCSGWIWRITKNNHSSEQIEIHCLITNVLSDVTIGSDSGENQEAIAADNNDWVLHIGTEDEEAMYFRAINNDWMPNRFANTLKVGNPFTTIESNGMTTKVPELNKDEKIYFHFLTAYDKYNNESVNTWLAVEESKRELYNWVGI